MRRRLERVARAEHELRGPATVLALACERMRRTPGGARHAELIEVQLDRLQAGLADLAAARHGGRRPPTALPVDLATYARAAVAPWRQRLDQDARGATVEWEEGAVGGALDRGAPCPRPWGTSWPTPRSTAKAMSSSKAGAFRAGSAWRFETASGVRWGWGRRDSRRGRGLAIAGRAARELGGRLEVRTHEGGVGCGAGVAGPPAVGARARRVTPRRRRAAAALTGGRERRAGGLASARARAKPGGARRAARAGARGRPRPARRRRVGAEAVALRRSQPASAPPDALSAPAGIAGARTAVPVAEGAPDRRAAAGRVPR